MVGDEATPLLQGFVKKVEQEVQEVVHCVEQEVEQDLSYTSWRGPVTRFSRRWDVLCLLSLLSLLQTIVWNSWGPLAFTSAFMYDWSPATLALLAAWGCLVPLLAICPVLLLARKSLRAFLLLTSGCTALGTLLRAFTLGSDVFTLTNHVCAALNGVSSTVISPVIIFLAFLWFPKKELQTALTISVIIASLGPGLPFLLVGQIVTQDEDLEQRERVEGTFLYWYLYSQAISAVIFFVFTLIYFPAGNSRSRSSLQEEARTLLSQVFSLAISPTAWVLVLAAALPQAVIRVWLALAVHSLGSVCVGEDCLPQDWVNTLAIIACLASMLAGVAAVRCIQLSRLYLRLTLLALYITATIAFIFLYLVTLQILPYVSILKMQISILFLFVMGYSLISSAAPLVIKLILDSLSPLPVPPIGVWLCFWTQTASAVFLCIWSVSSVPVSGLHYILPTTLMFATLLLLIAVRRG
jgi:FLVCR family MFS transporter